MFINDIIQKLINFDTNINAIDEKIKSIEDTYKTPSTVSEYSILKEKREQLKQDTLLSINELSDKHIKKLETITLDILSTDEVQRDFQTLNMFRLSEKEVQGLVEKYKDNEIIQRTLKDYIEKHKLQVVTYENISLESKIQTIKNIVSGIKVTVNSAPNIRKENIELMYKNDKFINAYKFLG